MDLRPGGVDRGVTSSGKSRRERQYRGAVVHGWPSGPKQLDRFRDRHTAAGAKDDRRDALVLADSLRTDRPAFRRVRVDDPRIIHLRALSRLEDDLQADLSRVTNRIREQVYRVAPTQTGFLAIVRVIEDDVVYPRLMGHGIHLHALAVIVVVLAAVELGGVAGIFLAISVVAALSVAWRHGLGWLDERQGAFRL